VFKKLRIRPDREGTQVALYDLEADIMDIVWSADWEKFSVRDVLDRLSAERSIAYTTVMTTVGRLYDKGLLEREKSGRKYLYWPVMGRQEFQARMAVEVMRSLPDTSRDAALSMLIDELDDTDRDTLDRLTELIESRKRALDDE
jgi:predicted transcriptional regulator